MACDAVPRLAPRLWRHDAAATVPVLHALEGGGVSKMSLSVQKMARASEAPEAALVQLSRADQALAAATSVLDALQLVKTAKAVETWVRAEREGAEHARMASVFVLRAKRNAGQRIGEAQGRGDLSTQARHPGSVGADDTAPATLPELGVSRDESSEWKRLASEWSDDELTAAASEMERPSLAGIQQRAPGMFTSDTPEWYTPKHIVAAVVAVLGAIDLDPCADAAKGIPATTHYTAAENGLEQGWRGRVYMNPPYGREIVAWVEKLAEEFRYGNVTEAIALVPARVDTTWWRTLPHREWLAVNGRLSFSGHENPAPFPSAVAYMGPNWPRFREVFAPLGDGYSRWDVAA